jgi:DNA-binding NarL/FixJ family response regulator
VPAIHGADLIALGARRAGAIACPRPLVAIPLEAGRSGAEGYVLKTSPATCSCKRLVRSRPARIHRSCEADVVRLVSPRRSGPEAELTAQELQVIRLAAEGLTNQKIAMRVGNSMESVKLRLRSSFRKLGAKDRASAVAAAIRRGLI